LDERAGWNARYLKRRRLRVIGLLLLVVLVLFVLAQSCSAWLLSSGDQSFSLSSGSADSADSSSSSGSSGSSGSSDSQNSPKAGYEGARTDREAGAGGRGGDTRNSGGAEEDGNGGLFGLGGGSGDSKDSKNSDGEKAREAEKPFAAIPPPEGAKPLRDRSEADTAHGQYGGRGDSDGEEDFPPGRMLARGAEDPSDGPLQENRLVAYYGTPLSGYMGILGELKPEEMMAQLKKQTRAYSAADPERPAVPTIELIASVAQRNPGPEGLYVQQTPVKEIRRYSRLAKKNDALLLLDVQLGRDDLMNEVKKLEPFLKQEHVHLAIDTEYSVGPGQVPGINLGTIAGSDIQRAVRYMDRLVEKENIPDKLVVVHQFETGIVSGKQNIKPTKNVQVSLNADGFGGAAAKLSKYDILVGQQPIQYGGFKIFYRQDYPVLSPEEVLQMEPAPAVVNYQ
jgi:hypothetical protein